MQEVVLPIPAFYQMASFVPLSVRTIRKEKPFLEVLEHCNSNQYRRQMLSYFDTVTFERVGILEGEYALICDCNLVVARDGTVIKAASASEDFASSRNINELCATQIFLNAIDNILEYWNRPPLVESPAILSDAYLQNYFHFSLEMLPRIRHLPVASLEKVIVGESALHLPFQTSLLGRGAVGCTFIRAPRVLRVRNPIVSHDNLSEDGIRWLRRIGPRVQRGTRRIYVRRGLTSTRTVTGGGLEETPEFLDLLNQLNFEIIDFGSQNTIEVQASMLDGAAIVLAAHGAALTNIAYLEEGVSVLEVIGAMTPRAFFMHICATLNLNWLNSRWLCVRFFGNVIKCLI